MWKQLLQFQSYLTEINIGSFCHACWFRDFCFLNKYEIEEALDEQFERQHSLPEEELHLDNEVDEEYMVIVIKSEEFLTMDSVGRPYRSVNVVPIYCTIHALASKYCTRLNHLTDPLLASSFTF